MALNERVNLFPYMVITLLSAVAFIPWIGSVHLFDWDEINFAESAREMLITGNYSSVTINFEPFWEKPPLFIWMQALSMKLFGVNEFAARFPEALCGIATLNLIYYVGRKHFHSVTGLIWVICYFGSYAPNLYFRTGIIDPVFNLFIFLGIYQLFLASTSYYSKQNNRIHFLLCGVFIGLAVLTKGPVALLVVGLCGLAFLFIEKFRLQVGFKGILSFLIGFVPIVFAWFGPETIKNGPWFLQKFIQYQIELFSQNIAGHQQPWFYHPIVLLLACFPASILALKSFKIFDPLKKEQALFHRWMQILFWVVLILFSIVKTKIVHYSSLCWLPLTFMAALTVSHFVQNKRKPGTWLTVLFIVFGALVSGLMALIPFLSQSNNLKQLIIPYIKDCGAVESIMVSPHWYGFEPYLGVALALLMLVLGIIGLTRNKNWVVYSLLVNGLLITVYSALVIPKIEQHSQGSIINFYKSVSNKDCYIKNIGFKSYAHYFYAKMKPLKSGKYFEVRKKWMDYRGYDFSSHIPADRMPEFEGVENEFLINGPIDKPVYIITKCAMEFKSIGSSVFTEILSKGGYRVYVRNP